MHLPLLVIFFFTVVPALFIYCNDAVTGMTNDLFLSAILRYPSNICSICFLQEKSCLTSILKIHSSATTLTQPCGANVVAGRGQHGHYDQCKAMQTPTQQAAMHCVQPVLLI